MKVLQILQQNRDSHSSLRVSIEQPRLCYIIETSSPRPPHNNLQNNKPSQKTEKQKNKLFDILETPCL
jgi:hypothetical protein